MKSNQFVARYSPLLFLLAGCAAGQPSISNDGVRNAASQFPGRGYLTAGIARGSRFVLQGTGFLDSDQTATADVRTNLQTELAGVTVQFTASQVSTKAYLLSVSPTRIEGILPSNFSGAGRGTLRLATPAGTVDSSVFVASQKFGIYTVNGLGSGPAVAYQTDAEGLETSNSLFKPARPGQIVTLPGTGLGARKSASDFAEPSREAIAASIRLLVGGKETPIRFQGSSSRALGVDEVEFEVPADVEGCYVPVVVETIGRITTSQIMDAGPFSNFGTISVAAEGSTCSDAMGLSADELALVSEKGALRVATVSLSRVPIFDQPIQYQNSIRASFAAYDGMSLLRMTGIYGLPSVGSCVAVVVPRNVDPPAPAGIRLDAGDAITVAGIRLERQADGTYAGSSGGFVGSGGYVLENGAGGADVGPFEAQFAVNEPPQWLNKTVRQFELEGIKWSGGDGQSLVVISEVGYNDAGSMASVCVERSSKGSFVKPANTYRWLGENGEFGPYPAVVSFGSLAGFARFQAPGLDAGFIAVFPNDSLYLP